MELILTFVCLIITLASTATIDRNNFTLDPELNFLNASKDGTLDLVYHNVKIVSEFAWIAQLPKNASLTEQHHIYDEFLHLLENHIDDLRNLKRIEQENHPVGDKSEIKEDQNTGSFSLADFVDIFPFGLITVSPENEIMHALVMTDKIYDELDKKYVKETSWFQKVLGQMKSGNETQVNEYIDLVGDMVKELKNVQILPPDLTKG